MFCNTAPVLTLLRGGQCLEVGGGVCLVLGLAGARVDHLALAGE